MLIYLLMEFLIIFRQSILPIFIIICAAFVYQRIVKPDIKQVSALALNVFAPLMVFDALYRHSVKPAVIFKPFIFMIILTAVMVALAYGASLLLKSSKNERISLILAASLINSGNFGLPLILFTYGEEAIAYSVIYFVAFVFRY